MNNSNQTEPIVPPLVKNKNLTRYFCPHCNGFLFKGDVRSLNMVCHHCQTLINVKEDELLKLKTDGLKSNEI